MNAQALADEILTAQAERRPLAPLSERVHGFDETAAYEVARLMHETRVHAGARPFGRKIGFSNRDLWPLFQITAPVWGYLYESSVTQLTGSSGSHRIGALLEPRIEPEIVLHFHSTPRAGADAAAILACVDWVAHGFELVQSHFPGWKFQAADTVAASALHAALLIGEHVTPQQLGRDAVARLEDFTVTLFRDGEVRDRGRGSNVLGSPLDAIAHLIAVLARQPRGQPLAAGELVTTGSLTGAPFIDAGETWSTTIEGIALPGLSVKLET